jgi:hypothetical protein
MGVGIGGGGFGVRGGIKVSSSGVGGGVGVGPLSATGGCGVSSIVWLIGVVVVFILAIYLLPILIAAAAGYLLLHAARNFQGGRDASLVVFGLTLIMVLSGGLGIWLWADTIGNWRHSVKVPETSSLTVEQAEKTLREAGFTKIQFDLAQPAAALDLSRCEVSDTEPAQFLDADDRDPIVISGWCSDGALRTARPAEVPSTPQVPDTPSASAPTVSADPTIAFCQAFIEFYQSDEFKKADAAAGNPDDLVTLMDAFDGLYTRGQPLVAALPPDAPAKVRASLQAFFRDVRSIAETGSADRKSISLDPVLGYVQKVCE